MFALVLYDGAVARVGPGGSERKVSCYFLVHPVLLLLAGCLRIESSRLLSRVRADKIVVVGD